jgi:hypothetical protein
VKSSPCVEALGTVPGYSGGDVMLGTANVASQHASPSFRTFRPVSTRRCPVRNIDPLCELIQIQERMSMMATYPGEGSKPGKPGDEAPQGTPGTGENTCPECQGTGKLDGKECPNCRGTGKIIEGIGGG